jgi:RNA polymerase sigma-70 factor (ECF subfamily)
MIEPIGHIEAESAKTDEQLAREAQAGCGASLAALIERMRPRLVHYLWQRTGRWADAEDITQDALARAVEKLDRYDSRWKFSTWLFTIGHRMMIDAHRGRRPAVSMDATGPLADPASPAVDRLAHDEQSRNIWATAGRVLGDDQYAALWLKYGEDMDTAEIARVMNRTRVAVRVMLMRARNKLAAHLGSDQTAEANDPDMQPASTGGIE